MPSGLIKEDNGVRSEGDLGCDLVEMGTPITLRQGARVIEDSRRLRVV
jgi:hypothetical protein